VIPPAHGGTVRRLVQTEVRFAVTEGGLDGIADSVPGMPAGQQGDALAQTAAQAGQVLVQTTQSSRRITHGVSEQGRGTHDRTSFRSAGERRANYGTNGGSWRSESTAALTARACLRWDFREASSRASRDCASTSSVRIASASTSGSDGVAGPSPLSARR